MFSMHKHARKILALTVRGNHRVMKYTCPCCGYISLDIEPPGTFTICDVCNWEDDTVEFNNPDYEGGANGYSLRQSQYKYANGYKAQYNKPAFEKDPSWKLLPEKK
jgi:hypothetical protein